MIRKIDRPQENVWPKLTIVEIDESVYSFFTLIKVLCGTISGIMFLLLSSLLLVLSMMAEPAKLFHDPRLLRNEIAVLFMNLMCFGIVLLVIHLIKIKITGTSNDVSISLLLRYYNLGAIFSTTLIVLVNFTPMKECLGGHQCQNPNFLTMHKIPQILFYCSLGMIMVLSVIMALYRGTLRERCMRFFFMWPLKDEQNDSKKPDKLLHILWMVRQLIQAFVIAYTMVAIGLVIQKFAHGNKHLYLEYESIRAFFQAGFCEEYFKFFVAASVPFIAKYSQSKSAILHVSIMVGLSFALVEDILYCMIGGYDAFMRVPMFPIHFVFAYPAAVAITRQRDSIVWIFELIGSFLIGVAAHGIFDYLLFISPFNPDLTWCGYVAAFGLGGLFIAVGAYILWKNPFLPEDKLEKKEHVKYPASTVNV
jgi:hypothetical protein